MSQSPRLEPGPRRAHLPQRRRTLDELGAGAAVLQGQMETLRAELQVGLGALQKGHKRDKRELVPARCSGKILTPRLPLKAPPVCTYNLKHTVFMNECNIASYAR